MTAPTGVCFVSYKRERAEEVAGLINALHEVGIPTWQDVSNLGSAVTEDELKRVLADPSTSSAVMFVTPEVATSEMIRSVEVPAIMGRTRGQDAFFVLPVAAGGLDYGQVGPTLGPRTSLVDLTSWNILKSAADPLGPPEAARVAARVLDLRLAAINGALQSGDSVRIRILTRDGMNRIPGDGLILDFRHLFIGRHAIPNAWDETISPALSAVVGALRRHMPGRSVDLCGNVALPAAVAIGSAMSSLSGIAAGWIQEQIKFGQPPERWSLGAAGGQSGFEVDVHSRSVTGTDLALLVSATNDVMDDFSVSTDGLPLRGVVHVRPSHPRPDRLHLNGPDATQLASLCVDALRAAATRFGARGDIHLFLAVPAGVAFMIGQQLNTFGRVRTYEHDPVRNPPYVPAAVLLPST